MTFLIAKALGNLGTDVETKYTPNGAMLVEFSLAHNPPKKNGQEQDPIWLRCTGWDKIAERLDKLADGGYVAKGRTLYIEGDFLPRQFTDRNGTERVSYDVTVFDFRFVGGGEKKNDDDQSGQAGSGARPQQRRSAPARGRNADPEDVGI